MVYGLVMVEKDGNVANEAKEGGSVSAIVKGGAIYGGLWMGQY